ncbi:uncharacterized protein LOC127838514 isoform X5 [Dreissena polymorpha]|uniref:uncharacterized protein LOC127838514 isoform X5 n=1 Tax=Dreissena polymorpha TaxID=45954 RepID=UPI002264CB31|nr:uncharacterized protein LOC127838514 isoform X5 [Dreissena polymorpha]
MCEYSCRGEKRVPVQPRYHKISASMSSTMGAYNTLTDDGSNFTNSSVNVESLEDLNKRYADDLLPLTITFGVFTLFGFLGTIMCGINTTTMVNKYGTNTTIHLCETEEKFEASVWRNIYKWIFIILLGGISLAYIIMYTFVMRAAAKQIKAISLQRNNSSFDFVQTSSIFDTNMIVHEPTNDLSIRKVNKNMRDIQNAANGKHSVTRCSCQSHKRHTPMLQRHGFPTKTIIWFILTIVFIVTYFTHIILSLRVGKIVTMEPGQFASFSFFFRIYFVNHMINPLVYAIFVKRFRESCRNIGPLVMEKLSQFLC